MSVPPKELSLFEIRRFMLDNNCRVTNHALVKHFKKFLTNTETANEARKKLKTYANILATIKVEDNQKFLILRKKYLHECPTEDEENKTVEVPPSPGGNDSVDAFNSPFRQPPPYKEPPKPHQDRQTTENYRDCVNEFAAAVRQIDPNRMAEVETAPPVPPALPPKNKPISRQSSVNDEDKENISISSGFTVSSGAAVTPLTTTDSEKSSAENNGVNENSDVENPISVKEATRKFNRMASQEESKILSPPNKKKVEKQMEDKISIDVTMTHPKAKEWIVTAAKADYQELAKLSSEYPELVKLQDPATGYTALHWASKHGKEDVVKLIAGTHKANVNAKTNGGYTPLHLAMQFGRDNIFDLLCNVYKANRDIMDYSGMKPLDYRKQRTCVSESTYSKIKQLKKQTAAEKDLGFLRIGSLNVRVKKTTEAFSNFLGVGSGNTTNPTHPLNHQLHHPHHRPTGIMRNPRTGEPLKMRASEPINNKHIDNIHKSWGSVDNIPQTPLDDGENMPPPKLTDPIQKKKRSKRGTSEVDNKSGYSSMPTTPNQPRSTSFVGNEMECEQSDSDSACGFGSNWSVGDSGNKQTNNFPNYV